MSSMYVFCRNGLFVMLLCVVSAFAQFSSNITGIVQDPSGARIPRATVTLLNTSTDLTRSTTSDSAGNYTFMDLGAGQYQVTASANGFATVKVSVSLQTSQMLALPVTLAVASAQQKIEVTGTAPVLNTADSRSQETLQSGELESIPLAGRTIYNLLTIAPGVTGSGTLAYGSPGSPADNFGTEIYVDANANGRNGFGNMWVMDGLDITSEFRQGVTNLSPNPDVIQEATVQTNTFSVEYGRSSSIQMIMTTRSGTDAFHGTASDYFTTQQFWAGTEFVHNYLPFHGNNMSGTVGGPLIPHHGSFFFFGIEPLRQSSSASGPVVYEDPAFTAWAQQNYPNTVGTKLLTNYPASSATTIGVAATAAQAFPGNCGTAGTPPCSLSVFDDGIYSATEPRNGLQYNLRIDQNFKKDRIYGNFFRMQLATTVPNQRPAFGESNYFHTNSVQFNETHTFSATVLNEAVFGLFDPLGHYGGALGSVPVVSVQALGVSPGTPTSSSSFGVGYAQSGYSQPNYHWRDVLSLSRGSHAPKFGYEGWHGNGLSTDGPTREKPSFYFTNMLNLVEDQPYLESGLAYWPLTGQSAGLTNYGFGSITEGAFAQDTWKIRKNITINYGLRFDDFGNPYPKQGTVLSNFNFGSGQTLDEQIANGFYRQENRLYPRALSPLFSPRFGVAWDPTGHATWVVRGGFGLYRDWPSMGNTSNELNSNPPSFIVPTFYAGTSNPPIFALGTSNKNPYGFPYPSLPATGLDEHGGLIGSYANVNAVNPNITTDDVYIFAATLERSLGKNLVASVGYNGQRGENLFTASGFTVYNSQTLYGIDINQFPGDLIQCNCSVPKRLNPSFGEITYSTNGPTSEFNGIILALRGRFGSRGVLNVSYTHSRSYDDAGIYPTQTNLHQYWGPSAWDTPNRFSLSGYYRLPGLNKGHGFIGRSTSGWGLSGTTVLESGYPFTVATYAPFLPERDSTGAIIGFAPGSGDFTATGDNFAYPNVTSYSQGTSRQAYLNGIFTQANFPDPDLGSQGNEKMNAFRNPGLAQTDAALSKNTTITERLALELRFEFYDLFNRPNLGAVDNSLTDTTFGRSLSQLNPRWFQVGARITF